MTSTTGAWRAEVAKRIVDHFDGGMMVVDGVEWATDAYDSPDRPGDQLLLEDEPGHQVVVRIVVEMVDR